MGAGGGESTQDCGNFDLFLATSQYSGCGRNNIARLTLTRTGIKEILPVCSTYKSKCNANANLPFGVEAHYFQTTIDFDNYSSYTGCAFEIYTQISWRTSGISTIDDDQPFYNFTYINPWEGAHHSPKFNSEIRPVLYAQQPVYYTHGVNDLDQDSISFHLVSALSDYDKFINYKGGYSPQYPLDAYCPGGGKCSPNSDAYPPIGFWFDSLRGNFAFTPVQNGQTAVIVMEARKWRNTGGKMTVISSVRRDLQYIILSHAENHPPRFVGSDDVVEVCAGEKLNLELLFHDEPYRRADSSIVKVDSLVLSWDSTIANAKFSYEKSAGPGNFKAKLEWQTSDSDVQATPYRITVFANDGFCPLNAITSHSFQILVKPVPKVQFSGTQYECGYINLKEINGAIASDIQWKITAPDTSYPVFLSNLDSALYQANRIGLHQVQLTGKAANSCLVKAESGFLVKTEDLKRLELKWTGNIRACYGDTLDLTASVSASSESTQWSWSQGSKLFSDSNRMVISSGRISGSPYLRLLASRTTQGRICIDSATIVPQIYPLPGITGLKEVYSCDQTTELSSLFNYPVQGEWRSLTEGVHVVNRRLNGLTPSYQYDQEVWLEYSSAPGDHGCINKDTVRFVWLKNPEFEISDQVICKGAGNFYIDNLLRRPASKTGLNIQYFFDSIPLKVGIDPINGRLFTPASLLTNGKYPVWIVHQGENGCTLADTGFIEVIDTLKVTYSLPGNLCGNDTLDLDKIYQISPDGGGWYSVTHNENVVEGKWLVNACGLVELSYTYDINSCYDRAFVSLNLECIPDIEWTNSFEEVCENHPAIKLNATPSGGSWTGSGMSGDIYTPANSDTISNLKYTVNGILCAREAEFPIRVIKAPSFEIAQLKEVICEGDLWDLSGLMLTSDSFQSIGSGLIQFDTRGMPVQYSYSDAERQIGEARLQFILTNDGKCAPLDTTIRAKVAIKPEVKIGQIQGCIPWMHRLIPVYTIGNDPLEALRWSLIDSSGIIQYTGSNPTLSITNQGKADLDLELITKSGCQYSYSFPEIIDAFPSPNASFLIAPSKYASQLDPVFHFTNKTTPDHNNVYQWNFGNGRISDQTHMVLKYGFDTGKYMVTLTATNAYGCTDMAVDWVEVGPDIKVYIPNAFSPDGIGPEQNARFRVVASQYQTFHMTIVNRLGVIVHQSSNPDLGWDGFYAGKKALPGVYVYQIRMVSKTGKDYLYQGTVTLLR